MVVLGRITAPYGVKGWLRLHPFGDDPASWRAMKRWWLGSDENDFSGWRAYPLQTMRLQGKEWVVKLTGVDDRNAAEQMVGSFVGAPRGDLPATDEDEFYWADLIGLAVLNEKQEALGHVTEMIESGAHAVMVVQDGEGKAAQKRLLPFVGQVVKDVDIPAGIMRVEWEADW
jgi:16S rRNA processing protein RimM